MEDRLAAILNRLRRRFSTDTDVAEIESYLSSKGYDRGQIGEVVSRFFADRRESTDQKRSSLDHIMTFRVLGPHEWGRFAPEAWGHLLSLSSSGALTAPQLEHVIDRALMHFDGRIALEDIRAILDGGGLDDSGTGLEQVNVH